MLLEDAIDKLNSMWSYDMLTKLYNRAGFFYEARTLLANMKEKNTNAFIVFFDLDGLKPINDTMGHEAGDQLIQAMADCIRYPFKLSTSIGCAAYKAVEIEDLSVLIELADQNMYIEKRRKKELKNKDDSQNNREWHPV